MITIATDVGDKINRELRSFGANIVVYPEESALKVNIGGVSLKPASSEKYLKESDLPRIKGIFWRHNILAFAPFLAVPTSVATSEGSNLVELVGTYFAKPLTYGGETFTTGVHFTNPLWKVEGRWPQEYDASTELLVGAELAKQLDVRPGDSVQVGGGNFAPRKFLVSGILSASGEQLWAPLHLAQQMASLPGAVGSITVSALTKPEDAFARRDPRTMSPDVRDRWYCSPYANSIAFQLSEAIPHAHAEQIRQVAQSEGKILSRIQGLMFLIALAALLAAALAVFAALATAVTERRREVGLMKAIGATRGSVAALFLAEGTVLGVIGGLVGFGLGAWLAGRIGQAVFGSSMEAQPALLPVVLLLAVLLVAVASATLVRRAANLDPATVLRGDL